MLWSGVKGLTQTPLVKFHDPDYPGGQLR